MTTLTSVAALSGVNAATLHLGVVAHNIANAQTPHFRRQVVAQAAQSSLGGVSANLDTSEFEGEDLPADIVAQKAASYQYIANLKVIKTQDDMTGALLNMRV